jgi:hypothetical protein
MLQWTISNITDPLHVRDPMQSVLLHVLMAFLIAFCCVLVRSSVILSKLLLDIKLIHLYFSSIFFCGVWVFCSNRKHLLNTLLRLEFLVLSLFVTVYFYLCLFSYELYFVVKIQFMLSQSMFVLQRFSVQTSSLQNWNKDFNKQQKDISKHNSLAGQSLEWKRLSFTESYFIQILHNVIRVLAFANCSPRLAHTRFYGLTYSILAAVSSKIVSLGTWSVFLCFKSFVDVIFLYVVEYCLQFTLDVRLKLNSMVWVRGRTIPTERPPLVGEVIDNFCG